MTALILRRRIVALLVEARRSRSITQAELGRRLGRSTNFVFRVEAGARHLDVGEFLLIARVLEIDPCTLLERAQADD